MYYIENKLYNVSDKNHSVNTFPIPNKYVSKPSGNITYPINIHLNHVNSVMREAFNIIQDKFTLVENLEQLDDYEVVNIYGGLLNYKDSHIVIPYITNLFISRIPNDIIDTPSRIYITRKDSAQFHNGTLKRHMLNEDEFINKHNDLTYILLEEYSFKQKIQLFMNLDVIVSSHSSSFSFLPFCKKDVTIIEILNKGTSGFIHNQYKHMTSTLGYKKYYNYNDIVEDKNGNYIINIIKFYNYYNTIIS